MWDVSKAMAPRTRKWVFLFLSLILFSGCHRKADLSPQANYDAVRLKFQRGDLSAAQAEAEQGIQQYVTTSPDWAGRFRVLEAEILHWRGMRENAFALLDSELPASLASDEVAVRRRVIQALTCCSLQQFPTAVQQFPTAEGYMNEAQKLASERQPALLGEVALGQGALALRRKEYSSAQTEFQRALKIARQQRQGFLEASTLGSLGFVEMNQQHFGQAIEWFEASLKVSQSIGARASMAKTQGNLGWCYYRMGDIDKALELFTQGEALSKQLGLRTDEVRWLTNIGNVHYERQEFDTAQDYYRQALTISEEQKDVPDQAISLNNLAVSAIEKKQFDDAERHNQEALNLRQDPDDRTSRLYFTYNKAKIALGRGKLLQSKMLLQQVIDSSSEDLSLRWMAHAKLATVYEALKQPSLADQQFRDALATFDHAITLSNNVEEYKLASLSAIIHFYNDYIAFLVQQGKSSEALHVVEINRARTLAEGLGLKPGRDFSSSITFRPQEAAARAEGAVFCYWLAPEHSYLWAITPSRTAMFVLPGEAEINKMVESYRRVLAGPRDPLDIADAGGQKLYEMLVAPAEKLIPYGSQVVIIPSGSLFELNFETLLAPGKTLHYWIEDVVISNASSLLLLRNSRMQKTKDKLLLIGDPSPANQEFSPLAQAAAEIEQVKKYFPPDQVKLYSGKDATARAYLQGNPEDFSIIHFVAHGVASRESPLDSAVILSGDESSYKLYARDIVEKRLRANLVTISSCEGASGKTYAGEGLVGLSWAFLRAGAHQVIAALWDVNDASTAQFMSEFYKQLNAGQDPAVALRSAKLAMLHSDSIYHRPFYWAPFQLYKGL